MRKYFSFVLLIVAAFYSGCAENSQPKPDKQTEIVLLNQQVQELDAKDKQLIYRSIQDDINRYTKEGDEAYENAYNYDAIKAYEIVNFYEGYSFISTSKINNIKKIAKKRTITHYKKGVKYSSANKKRAIKNFNIVMMNNPEYKDTKKRLTLLNSDREITIYVNSLESVLHTKVLNCDGDIDELRDINFKADELLQYDYKNSVALNAKEMLKAYRQNLLSSAVELYDKGKITKAQYKFNKILSIYKNDTISIEYIEKIEIKKGVQENLRLAKKYLSKKEYLKSIKYAKYVLKIDTKNKKAKKIITKAKKESRKKVTILVEKGKKEYNNRELDKSKKSFKAALKIDPYCNTAHIYSKKIDRQLKTIKSLE